MSVSGIQFNPSEEDKKKIAAWAKAKMVIGVIAVCVAIFLAGLGLGLLGGYLYGHYTNTHTQELQAKIDKLQEENDRLKKDGAEACAKQTCQADLAICRAQLQQQPKPECTCEPKRQSAAPAPKKRVSYAPAPEPKVVYVNPPTTPAPTPERPGPPAEIPKEPEKKPQFNVVHSSVRP